MFKKNQSMLKQQVRIEIIGSWEKTSFVILMSKSLWWYDPVWGVFRPCVGKIWIADQTLNLHDFKHAGIA